MSPRIWRDFLENILVAVFLALFVRTFVMTGYRVPTSSMAPTLLPGDFIFSYRLPYGIKLPLTQSKWVIQTPSRGDVVAFTFPEQPNVTYVKRVVGIGGDRIEIKRGRLLLNGQPLEYRDATSANFDASGFQVSAEMLGRRSHLVAREMSLAGRDFGPFIVGDGQVFLLGDNRDASDDSRYWGAVPVERIEGEICWIWLSLDWGQRIWEGWLPRLRLERLFTRVQ